MKSNPAREVAEFKNEILELRAENQHLKKFIAIEKRIGTERNFNQLPFGPK